MIFRFDELDKAIRSVTGAGEHHNKLFSMPETVAFLRSKLT